MKTYYYLGPNDETLGPHTLQELQELANGGAINLQTRLAAEGDREWKTWLVVEQEARMSAGGGPRGPLEGGAPRQPQAGGSMGTAGKQIAKASEDAFRAFRIFATNPVAGLPAACRSLDQGSVFGVGIVFGLVFTLCELYGIHLWTSHLIPKASVKDLLTVNALWRLAVPFGLLAAASALARTVFHGNGTLGTDCFIAGAALLPSGFGSLAFGLASNDNSYWGIVLILFGICVSILMLYSGLHEITQLSDQVATLAVPVMCIASAWLTIEAYFPLLQPGLVRVLQKIIVPQLQ